MAENAAQLEAEAAAYRVLEALGPERVERGLHAYSNYGGCCRSWQSCFIAQALDIHEDVARHNPAKLLKVAEQLDVKPSDVKTFISVFDNDNAKVPTRRLKEMCLHFIQQARNAVRQAGERVMPVSHHPSPAMLDMVKEPVK